MKKNKNSIEKQLNELTHLYYSLNERMIRLEERVKLIQKLIYFILSLLASIFVKLIFF